MKMMESGREQGNLRWKSFASGGLPRIEYFPSQCVPGRDELRFCPIDRLEAPLALHHELGLSAQEAALSRLSVSTRRLVAEARALVTVVKSPSICIVLSKFSTQVSSRRDTDFTSALSNRPDTSTLVKDGVTTQVKASIQLIAGESVHRAQVRVSILVAQECRPERAARDSGLLRQKDYTVASGPYLTSMLRQ
nr:hypothetical protein CFP56_63558 [Quercus suber]